MKVKTSIVTLLIRRYGLLLLLLGILYVAPIVRSAIPNHPFLGIPPQDEDYYKISSSDLIKCKDGSKKFTKAQLNDDFCDCPDATDEPGTSACPGGKFYCQNAGHAPVMIFSSRVNDGICDCCDGSDEYDGQVKCPNTCWEAGKVARDKLRRKIATYKEGVALRKQEVEQAKLAVAKDEAELLKLKDEEKILKGLVQQLKEHKEQIEKAEEKERLQKEKEEKERKEAEEKANRQNSEVEDESKQEKGPTDDNTKSQDKTVESLDDDRIGVLDDSPQHQDMTAELADPVAEVGVDSSKLEGSTVTGVEQHAAEEANDSVSPKSEDDSVVSEAHDDAGSEVSHGQGMKVEGDIPESTEGLSKEELGRLVASRWTGNTEENERPSSAKEIDHEDQGNMPQDTRDEEYDSYASETDDETGKYDDVEVEDDTDETYDNHDDAASSYKPASDDDFELPDATSPSNPSWLEKIQQTVRNILKAVNLFQTPVDITDAARVRKEYEESSTKLSKLQSRISSLTQKLKHDIGKDKEFYSFYNRCFESKQNKYVYKVCPFKQASQVEGHATTRLGNWDKFEDSYRAMIFSSGDRCWNGPDRSMKVKLRCGLTNEVTDVDEPSRCEYVALLSTPALCLEEKLKELEDKLEAMNREQPQGHDEL